MHAASPPAGFHAGQVSFRFRKVWRKPHRSTRPTLSRYGGRGYVSPLARPTTPDGNPLPPRKR